MRNLEDRLIRLEGNFGFIPHECSFVDIDTGVPRAEDGDTVVRGTRLPYLRETVGGRPMNRLEERLSRLEVEAGVAEHDCGPHVLVRVIVDPQLGAIGEMRRIVPCPVCGKGERYDEPYVEYNESENHQAAR